jgi:hypothetical protein
MTNVKINIGGKSYSLPQQITVRDFMDLNGFDMLDSRHNALICATLIHAPLADLQISDPTDVLWLKTSLLKPLVHLENYPLRAEINSYSLVNLDRLTIGDFADLDVLITEGVHGNLSQILGILYSAPVDEIEDWDMQAAWPAVLKYMSFREGIYKGYRNLFEINESSLDEGSEPLEEKSNPQSAKHAWYRVFMTLCNDRFLDLEKVPQRPLIEALNFLAYQKEKNDQINQKLQKELNKMKRK